MTVEGRWPIVQMPDHEADYPMMEPALFLFEANGSGGFAFDCFIGGIWGARDVQTLFAQPWPTSSTAC